MTCGIYVCCAGMCTGTCMLTSMPCKAMPNVPDFPVHACVVNASWVGSHSKSIDHLKYTCPVALG